ncbi:3'-5' DNA helicase, partial [Ceratobasidium sp. 395]
MIGEPASRMREDSPQDVKPNVTSVSLLDGSTRDEEFDFLNGNVSVKVENRIFCVHKFKLVKFHKIEQLVMSHEEIALEGSAEDFRNVLRILYASFESFTHFDPDTPTLISALLIATTYDYPQLRQFAIRQLEDKELYLFDYLRLARDFNVAAWEKPAVDYLISREEPITEAEAEMLGTKLFVSTVARREERLRGASLQGSTDSSVAPLSSVRRRMKPRPGDPQLKFATWKGSKAHPLLYDFLASLQMAQNVLRVQESSPRDIRSAAARLSLRYGAEQDEEFNFPDGNVYIRVENRIFFVHRYKLLKFRKIEEIMCTHEEIRLTGSAVDFLNVLRMLYVSPFDSLTPFNPDTPALISALRVATAYDYQDLRTFAIHRLELKTLPPLEYLPLACEFDIEGWKNKVLDHLVSRDEPVTEAEAEMLGMKLFVAAVVRREESLAQRLRACQPQDVIPPSPSNHPREPVTLVQSSTGRDSSDEITEIPSAPNTTPEMNPRGATPLALDGSGNGKRTRSNEISYGLCQTTPNTKVLLPVVLSTKQTKSWNHVKAMQRIQGYGKMRKVSVLSSDEESDEESEPFPNTATSDIVFRAQRAGIADSYQPVSIEQTQMKCKLDPQTIDRWVFPLNNGKQEYQLSIVENCLFDNTLISLPTGFNKTFIAGCVMLNFFNWFPTGKIVFVAPTEALFAQQIETCQNSCGIPRQATIELAGITRKAQRRRAWEERRMFYVTPQVFLNDLRDGTYNALDVVLVVIGNPFVASVDEAHRATGAHPYVNIVHFLMANNANHRVLALSTTLLKGDKLIQDIVDGLHISRIEIRDECRAGLQNDLLKEHFDLQIVEMNNTINVIIA